MNAPKITVLMPVYNAAPFLEEAIDSILNQTFGAFEFLIIDDGSSDSSIDIVKKYTDPRIRFLQNEKNLGISATLNRGIELASCYLIARMDADDISYPDRLEKQYAYMVEHPECGLLSTWARVITHDKQVVRLEKYPRQFYYYNLNFECWMYHPTIVFTKTAALKVGMYSKPYSEDYDLFWKLGRDFKIDNLDEPLVDYRLSPNSLNTVLRKTEYDIANRENVIRNLRYYMGDDFTLPEEHLECLRHNFAPILAVNDINYVHQCLDTLAQITDAIKQKPNVNLDVEAIDKAYWYKKDFIVEQIAKELPLIPRISFLRETGKTSILLRKLTNGIKWRLKFVQAHFQTTKST